MSIAKRPFDIEVAIERLREAVPRLPRARPKRRLDTVNSLDMCRQRGVTGHR